VIVWPERELLNMVDQLQRKMVLMMLSEDKLEGDGGGDGVSNDDPVRTP
jgi:hypothetical protein